MAQGGYNPMLSPVDVRAAGFTRRGVADDSGAIRVSALEAPLAVGAEAYKQARVGYGAGQAIGDMREGLAQDTNIQFGSEEVRQRALAEKYGPRNASDFSDTGVIDIASPVDLAQYDDETARQVVQQAGTGDVARKLRNAVNQGIVTEAEARARLAANLKSVLDRYPDFANEIRAEVTREFGEDFYSTYEKQVLGQFRQADQARMEGAGGDAPDLVGWALSRNQFLAGKGEAVDATLAVHNPDKFVQETRDALERVSRKEELKKKAGNSELSKTPRQDARDRALIQEANGRLNSLVKNSYNLARQELARTGQYTPEEVAAMSDSEVNAALPGELRAELATSLKQSIPSTLQELYQWYNTDEDFQDLGVVGRDDFEKKLGFQRQLAEDLAASFENPEQFAAVKQDVENLVTMEQRGIINNEDARFVIALSKMMPSSDLLMQSEAQETLSFLFKERDKPSSGGTGDPEEDSATSTKEDQSKIKEDWPNVLNTFKNLAITAVTRGRLTPEEQGGVKAMAQSPSKLIQSLSNPNYSASTLPEVRKVVDLMGSRDFHGVVSAGNMTEADQATSFRRMLPLEETIRDSMLEKLDTGKYDMAIGDDGKIVYQYERGMDNTLNTSGVIRDHKELTEANRIVKAYAVYQGAREGLSYEESVSPEYLSGVAEDFITNTKMTFKGDPAQYRGRDDLKKEQIDYIAREAAKDRGIDPFLLTRMISAESGYDTTATSSRSDLTEEQRAKGLVQMQERTFRQYSDGDIYDPYDNINAAADHISYLATKAQANNTFRSAMEESGLPAQQAQNAMVTWLYHSGEGNIRDVLRGADLREANIGPESLQHVDKVLGGKKVVWRFLTPEQREQADQIVTGS